ncbi:hypothetical protein MATL_G00174600 [Megalops atlanticus]|uniref:Uncharacterized protein n=1 Tax=Megalops atlanticus TaxID=7932 RepID=A0A9D3PRP2_MEGAT|nr:hypothetical protein MATL_G00174600 [Megalops atlanticus]
MQNSGGSRTQRYRPASEFDEATLARKREYWRTKKREQRAKLSELKKERANARISKCSASGGHQTVRLSMAGPTLLNSDGTYHTGVCLQVASEGAEKASAFNGMQDGENAGLAAGGNCTSVGGQPAVADQKERWFQKIKLNNVLPLFPAARSDSRNNPKGASVDRKVAGCSPVHAAGGTFSPAKPNGALSDSCSQVPAVKIKVPPIGSPHCQVQNEGALLNGSSSVALPQQHLVLQAATGHTPDTSPQLCLHVQTPATSLGQTTSDVPTGVKVAVPGHGPDSGGTNTSQGGTSSSSLECSISNAQTESPKNTQMEVLGSTVKKEADDSSPGADSQTAAESNHQAVIQKVEPEDEALNRATDTAYLTGPEANTVAPAPLHLAKATLWRQKLQDGSERWGVVRYKTQKQRFLESQRVISQRNARRAFTPAMASLAGNSQKGNKEENEEERMARRREYWRIKKREQRAKLSAEVKAKMKERDSLLRRVKRYQSILEEMRRTRSGGEKVPQPPGSTLPTDPETIGGFIKEDGTMTTNIPQASANLRSLGRETLPESRSFPNKLLPVPGCRGAADRGGAVLKKVHVTAPPPLKSSVQMKGTCHLLVTPPVNPPKLISSRARPASHGIAKNLQSPHAVVTQANSSLRRPHGPQSTSARLPLLKQRPSLPVVTAVTGKCSVARGEEGQGSKPAGCASVEGPAGSAAARDPTPELTEEERMAKKREYWRIKKREQRAKRSARARQALSQCRYGTAAQRQQNLRALAARRTVAPVSARAVTAGRPPDTTPLSQPDVPPPVQDNQGKIKQEEEPPPMEDASSGGDLPLSREIKPCLSPVPETEQDSTASLDSQATTLLAVASMKKLLEESLSSVADCNNLQPCKTEQVSPEEELQEAEVKPNLSSLSAGGEGHAPPLEGQPSATGSDPQSSVAQQVQSPSCEKLCHVPPTNQEASHTVQSSQSPARCQPAPQLPSSSQTPPHKPQSSQPPITHAPSCSHAPSSSNHLPLRRAQRLRTRRTGHCCSPEPPKQPANTPSQMEEDLLRKKREYWRIAKREQRAKKRAWEREMRKQGEQGRRQPVRATQGPAVCVVKTQKPELRTESHSVQNAPALHTTSSTPILLSSPAGTLTCLKAVATLPILKVVTPTVPILCPGTLQNTAPKNEPSGASSRQPAVASLSCSTLPVGGDGGAVGSTARLLLVESQQEDAPGANPESPRVKRWQLQVQDGTGPTSIQTQRPLPALQSGGHPRRGLQRAPRGSQSRTPRTPRPVTSLPTPNETSLAALPVPHRPPGSWRRTFFGRSASTGG